MDKIFTSTLRRGSSSVCAALALALALSSFGCGNKKPEEKEEEPKVVAPPPRTAKVSLITVQIPDTKGGYLQLGPTDFINGHYDQDIIVSKPAEGLNPQGEEYTAKNSGIFLSAPGLLWEIDPPSPVTITLTARGKSQTIKREPTGTSPKMAVSFLSFPDVFPPVFRERYELVIASYPGVPSPFSYTYTFNARRSDATSVYAKVLPGDGASRIRLGLDTPSFLLGKVVPSEVCQSCTIEVEGLRVYASVKNFVELPALPAPGDLRMTFPQRFSGLLVKNETRELIPLLSGNNTSEVSVNIDIPADLTTVPAWCAKKIRPAGSCVITRRGQATPSYFRFINSVPLDPESLTFGGTSGIASIAITGEATVTIRRDGHIMEKKKISLDSGLSSSIDNPLLPSWVLDDIRNALFSGAPEFKL